MSRYYLMPTLWCECLWWPHARPGLIMLRLVGEESSNVSSSLWAWAGPAGSSELHTWSHYGGWTHRAQSGTRPWAGHMGDTVASQEMGDVTQDIIARCQLDQWLVIIPEQTQLSYDIPLQWCTVTILWLFIVVSHQWTWGHTIYPQQLQCCVVMEMARFEHKYFYLMWPVSDLTPVWAHITSLEKILHLERFKNIILLHINRHLLFIRSDPFLHQNWYWTPKDVASF